MTDEERSQIIANKLEAEGREPEMRWYLSYATQLAFLGAIITVARGFFSAVSKAKQLGISPGGEVLAYPLAPDMLLNEKWLDRLLTKAEVEEAFACDALTPTQFEQLEISEEFNKAAAEVVADFAAAKDLPFSTSTETIMPGLTAVISGPFRNVADLQHEWEIGQLDLPDQKEGPKQ